MRVTTRGRYALRASLALARLQNQEIPVTISHLAETEQISSVFLEQIFFKLRRAGIVASVRGPGGGFRFARDPANITLLEILKAAGEELNVTDCDKHAKACEGTGARCASHAVWEDLTALLHDYFSTKTLRMVLDWEEKKKPKKG